MVVTDKVSEQPFENAYARNIMYQFLSTWSLCGSVCHCHI